MCDGDRYDDRVTEIVDAALARAKKEKKLLLVNFTGFV